MLNRRNFLCSLSTLPFLGFLFNHSKEEDRLSKHKCTIRCIGHYKNFHIHWTGWKFAQNSTLVVGQYLAFPIDKNDNRYFYSNTGGAVDLFKEGDCFDISSKNGRPIFIEQFFDVKYSHSSADEIMEKSELAIYTKNATLKDLLTRIDKVC